MSSDWQKKILRDKYLQHCPVNIRSDVIARWEAEKDKEDKKSKKTVSVEAPPFVKGKDKEKSATGQADEPKLKKSDKKPDKKSKDDKGSTNEVMTGSLGMVSPRPFLVTSTPGTEVMPNYGFSSKTSAADTDGHTHTAYYDEFGNGETSMDAGHKHDIRSFTVSDYGTPQAQQMHRHVGMLVKQERTPGSEYKDYRGIL